ncbi:MULTISPECIES: queuosine precursor transporter [Pseudovibrio]|uniref:queuosine precursor transporter n=1 Tax=Stappiaceae TaxID=2821832 RepID=UPI0023670F69|nr:MULTISPECIES: queuosine precursor transporter [Pseudovibrio]MDD7909341.1 queuosine precursor transporter [Pseudovibrio exalbescens]MDX5594901.1 queuosine precursor transporter [Pseudovibrio sp. SPO723]
MTAAKTNTARPIAIGIMAMTAVVVASNILVQYPVHGMLGSINLADLLTWGAFTYPAAFLVTDLINRRFGPQAARRVVYAGFAVAVVLSIVLATPRIALASGSAFLFGQLFDVAVFNRLRGGAWWKAPVISSTLGSILDTLLFFSIAFAGSFAFLGYHDDFAVGSAPLLGAFALEVPRWISWALGDFCVKLIVAMGLLVPYRVLMMWLVPAEQRTA